MFTYVYRPDDDDDAADVYQTTTPWRQSVFKSKCRDNEDLHEILAAKASYYSPIGHGTLVRGSGREVNLEDVYF